MTLEAVFRPCSVGNLRVPNRIFMSPMSTNLARNGLVTPAMISHYTARAKSGIGLIMLEAAVVHQSGRNSLYALGVDRDECYPGLSDLVLQVHECGARIGIQLFHAGLRADPAVITTPPLGPNSFLDSQSRVQGRIGIEELVTWFRGAAERAVVSGFDLLEVHIAHGYLLHQFLTLHCTGGDPSRQSFERRKEVPLAIVREVIASAGGVPVTVRLSIGDLRQEGFTEAEATALTSELAEIGVCGAHISAGVSSSCFISTIPSCTRSGYLLPTAVRLREAVPNMPLFVSGRIHEPTLLEGTIRFERADMVGLGRALVADPLYVVKLQDQASSAVVACSYCNKCYQSVKQGFPLACKGREVTS